MRHPVPKLEDFTPQEIYFALIKQCNDYGLDDCFKELVATSFSEEWEWDYNGVTLMPDEKWPVIYAWCHDFQWITGLGGKDSDVLMRYLIEKMGYGKRKATLYYHGVRFGWEFPLIGYGSIHRRKGNVRSPLPCEIKCFKIAKNYYI